MRLKTILLCFFFLAISMNPMLSSAGFVEKKIEKTQTVNVTQAATQKGDYYWWKDERAKRQKAIDDYLKKNNIK